VWWWLSWCVAESTPPRLTLRTPKPFPPFWIACKPIPAQPFTLECEPMPRLIDCDIIRTNLLHPDDTETFRRMRDLSVAIAEQFDRQLWSFVPKPRPLPGNAYGLCYPKLRTISVVF